MSMAEFTVHDHQFSIEGSGFVKNHATEDFERGVDAIRDHLAAMPHDEVAVYHHTMWDWAANNCEGERPEIADVLENIGHREATVGWKNPSAVFVSVEAIL